MQKTVFLLGPEQVELRTSEVLSPGRDEVLIAVRAATTCGTDLKVFRRGGHPRMLVVPTPFGHEMSGTIVEVGADVKDWGEGQDVVVANSASCGQCRQCLDRRENLCGDLQYLNGAYSNYLIVPDRFVRRSLYRKPDSLPFEHAALAEPLACVLHGFDLLGLDGATDVLVIGGGPIGLLFVDVLVAHGHDVTLADPHDSRLAVGRALGARHFFKANRDGRDTSVLRSRSLGGEGYSVVVEATGATVAWQTALTSVRTGGTVLLFGGCAKGTSVPLDTHSVHYSELRVMGAYHHRPETFRRAISMLAEGKLHPGTVLSGETTLDAVAEALAKMGSREGLKYVIRP
jgi:L-iditol 2-dehydrogenase